jgi:cellulose synthase/poly-beta-1,6-N-acetylglucosamine synthase-like glycosyltransferase
MTLTGVAAILLAIVGVLLLFPVGLLFVEVVASLRRLRAPGAPPAERPRIAVLVPAHDEALSISATLKSIRAELTPTDRLLVVADNCTDKTAELARAAGAEVIERNDMSRRGKGFALDYGVRHLANDPPSVVIINDADCRPTVGAYARIAVLADQAQRPVQAYYEMAHPKGTRSLYLNFAVFAIRVKNLARSLGRHRLGLASQLMGTGMAFPWVLISKADLATSEIVEDLAYGLELTRDGHPPMFCPSALVVSEFPMTKEGQNTQRTRWDSGHLNIIANRVPRLLLEAIKSRNNVLLMLALDAAVPPLAFLALLVAGYALVAIILALAGGSLAVLQLAVAMCVMFSTSVFLAWWRVGKDVVSLYELALAPAYVVSKLTIYGSALVGQKAQWVRSRRDPN